MSKSILQVKAPDITDTYVEDEEFEKELEKISLDAICNSNQTKVIKEIRKCLANTLRRKYGFTNGKLKELTTKILKIHGLDESNFDCIANFDKFVNSRLNDVSIDDNSNKNEKSIRGIHQEVNSSNDKLIGYHLLYQVMKELYGKPRAQLLAGDMYDYSIGLSDSSKIDVPYCWALDASKIVIEGRKFGQLPSAPAKRLDSYIAALNETVHQMSSHLAGALAIGSMFLDSAHLLIFKERIPFEKVKEDKDTRKYIENQFQKFIHSVNHLSRNGVESPFTNISVFDRPKLKFLIGKENYAWYFPNKDAVAKDNGLENKMTAEEWENFVIEYIMEIQKIYLDFHNKGDPLQNGLPYRFPVCTLNFSRNSANELEDKEYLKYACSLDIKRFNIYNSNGGSKVASCCRLINDAELLDMASTVNTFGGSTISLGSHRVCSLNFSAYALMANSKEEFYKILDKKIYEALQILKAHKVLIAKLEKQGLEPFITRGYIRLDRLFSTIGICGIVECAKFLCIKFSDICKDSDDEMDEFLTYLNDKSRDYAKELGIISNIEQIPGESYCVRLANVNKMIFADENGDYYFDDGKEETEEVEIYDI